MMLHGFKSSKQDFTFGSWKVTAAKNHIMKSKDIERAESEHAQEVLRPFDWTFTTDYRGTLLGEELQIKVTNTEERIDIEKLKAREHIMFFEEVLLFEDELHDHGVSMISVKIRVMPSSFFLLQRFFLRVDGVLIRINDTRVYYEDGKDYMLREFSTRENTITELKFLKSEADLEYIERRLKLDFINGASESGSFAKENVTGILENLKSMKAKHSLLRCQVSQITDAQKGSMELIRNRLGTAMELIKHCQQTSHLEVESLAESEQGSAMFLDSTISSITAELKS
ncbi:TIP41-like protein isoform X9 [Xiphophorus hellerii]|uniref:TIP41-like protein isoform X9 n=1 Tax=Xiphophorus hellerii TaxID=8084 RepID=UPI0013B404F1|nr:TIP41-like protein isoform X9 [Xiphophorus hellerii]